MINILMPRKGCPLFYVVIRLPRKIKKEVKKKPGVRWKSDTLSVEQKMWYLLYKTHENYHRFLIKGL